MKTSPSCGPAAPAFAWVYDITNERLPVPIATCQVPGLDIDGRRSRQ